MKKKICDHENCDKEGLYRAPKNRHALRDYYWFCLAHVKEYNKDWNYFAGMSEAEIETAHYARDRGLDETKDKIVFPKRMSVSGLANEIEQEFAHLWGQKLGNRKTYQTLTQILGAEITPYLDVLGLNQKDMLLSITINLDGESSSRQEVATLLLRVVRKRYRELAKSLHPDMQPEAHKNEALLEDFRNINLAYKELCLKLAD